MQNVKPFQIAVAFTGSFLGAGFVSGQELLQFFGEFGGYGILGMLLTVGGFWLFSVLSMLIAKRANIVDFDKVIIGKEGSKLRTVFGAIIYFFLFGVMIIMIAGAGSLLRELFGMPLIAANALMTVLVILVAVLGTQGLLASFSLLVPALVAVAIVVGIAVFVKFGGGSIEWHGMSGSNPLLGNWVFAFISYTSHNLMAAVSILVPLSAHVKEEKTIHKGMLMGSGLLLLIFLGILLPVTFHKDMIADADLPMLTFAQNIGVILGWVYAVLLLGGMFMGALSSLYAMVERVKCIGPLKGLPMMIVISLLSLAGSLFGFKELVGTVFPIFGYIGFLALPGILHHYFMLRKHKNTVKKGALNE